MKTYKERRRFPRIIANCAMSFKRVGSGTQVHALCVNISGSGMLFEADESIELGRALEIRTFPADSFTPPITALVEVIRCEVGEHPGRHRIAGVIRGIKSHSEQASF